MTLPTPRFVDAVWLFPAAVVFHVVEEWLGRFPDWVRSAANPAYSDAVYIRIHAVAILSAIALAGLLHYTTRWWVLLAFFALSFLPGIFFNTLFHAGATIWSHRYCAGFVTAIVLYLPITWILVGAVRREGLLGGRGIAAAFLLAGAFHFWEVGRNVFRAW